MGHRPHVELSERGDRDTTLFERFWYASYYRCVRLPRTKQCDAARILGCKYPHLQPTESLGGAEPVKVTFAVTELEPIKTRVYLECCAFLVGCQAYWVSQRTGCQQAGAGGDERLKMII